jgi:membrane protease YdiL (CAAX protease family)
MTTEVAERAVDSEQRSCACGNVYPSAIPLCPWCSRPTPGAGPGENYYTTPTRVKGVRLALGTIVLNIISQGVVLGMVHVGRLETHKAINLSLWMGIGYYALVLLIISGPLMVLRPRWLAGNKQTAPVLGIEVGLLAAASLVTLLWVATGHAVLDPSARALVSEGSAVRIVFAFVVIVVAAPLVEELLFRGVVAESLAGRGTGIAIGVSSFLFALAHLRSLPYYTAMGVLFGLLYWRRGLWASIGAHATFNGCLVVLALVVALGPARVLTDGGVSMRAPSDWELATPTAAMPENVAFAVQGPSGSSIVALSYPVPDGAAANLERLASSFNDGAIPLPDGTQVSGSARVRRYGAAQGVEVPVTVKGHAGVVVLIPTARLLWEIDVATAGSARAEREYPAILQSVTLPGQAI